MSRNRCRSRPEPLQVEQLVNTIRDLCHPRSEEPAALAEVMEQCARLRGRRPAVVGFMVGENEEGVGADRMDAAEALESLGLERARNLAITFFALNYEQPKSLTFDWTPLWRHQISVGVVIDFIYDALDLRRSGLEYATGTFHDIGKMILAELFPFAFFTSMNRSIHSTIPLAQCEREMFKMTHAEIAAKWLRDHDFPGAMVDAIAQHETPGAISKRATLSHALVSVNHLVKELGIGYSGNAMLDPHPWNEHPSTYIIWEARGNRTYGYEDFTRDILNQFQSFPDLV